MVNRVKKMGRVVGAIKSGYHSLLGKGLSQAVNARAMSAVASPPAYKKGGVVRKGGLAVVHKAEKVLTLAERKQLKKLSGM